MPAAPFRLTWFLQGSSIEAQGEPWIGRISAGWRSCNMFLDLVRKAYAHAALRASLLAF